MFGYPIAQLATFVWPVAKSVSRKGALATGPSWRCFSDGIDLGEVFRRRYMAPR